MTGDGDEWDIAINKELVQLMKGQLKSKTFSHRMKV